MTAALQVVCGPVGVGKTTYGRRLAAELRAAHLVIDEWMQDLFVPDAPVPLELAWMLPRVIRCEARILAVAGQLAAVGVPSVIEPGWFRRDERDRFRAAAAAAGLAVQVHHLTAPAEVRRQRVRARNLGGDTLTILVDDGVFAWAEGYYQPLAADERAGAHEVDTSGPRP
ncbi:MAG: AAA family ATPase [Kofleriaceae bacterium]